MDLLGRMMTPARLVRYKPIVRNVIKQITPPVIFTFLIKVFFRNRITYTKYANWEEAQKGSTGYDEDNVIEKVRHSAKLVFDGNAVYERDSVIFDRIEYSWPLLASLLFAAANSQSLRVIDFGGALETTFQQNRKFLNRLKIPCEWRIVEQPRFVKIGKEEFTNESLSFYSTIEEAIKDGVDVVLFGGSICYVPDPYKYLESALESKSPNIIFDRTPITNGSHDTFAVQNVPPAIYEASYPIRNFAYDNLMRPFAQHYDLVEEWVCDLQADAETTAMGFLFNRKGHSS